MRNCRSVFLSILFLFLSTTAVAQAPPTGQDECRITSMEWFGVAPGGSGSPAKKILVKATHDNIAAGITINYRLARKDQHGVFQTVNSYTAVVDSNEKTEKKIHPGGAGWLAVSSRPYKVIVETPDPNNPTSPFRTTVIFWIIGVEAGALDISYVEPEDDPPA